MTAPTPLHAALRACARGLYPAEAGVELLINHATWLRRDDFRNRFIHHNTSITDSRTKLAQIDWPAAITALDHGHLPTSSTEQQILRLAASIADGLPVDLRDTLTSLDHHNINLVITAILHTSGQPPTPPQTPKPLADSFSSENMN
jgi:hypothetical protein